MEASKVLKPRSLEADDNAGETAQSAMQGEMSLKWLGKIVNTMEFHKVLATVVYEIFENWAGDNRFKRFLAIPAADVLKNELAGTGGQAKIAKALEDPEVMEFLAEVIPDLADQVSRLAAGITRAYEKLSMPEQKKLASDLMENLDLGQIGVFINQVVMAINRLHDEEPDFLVNRLTPQLGDLIASVDFGELRDLAETASHDFPGLVGVLMESLFAYPTKLVIAGSLLPLAGNVAAASLLEVLSRVNSMAPDTLTDVVLSFQREVDGKFAGKLVNQVAELIRKIHTGSALLGEPGRPAFAQSLSSQLEAMIREIDGPLLLKARSFLIAGFDTLDRVTKDTLKRHNDHLMLHLSLGAARRNFMHRARLRSLSMLADMPDSKLGPAMAHAASSWNAHDLAETVNLFVQLINRARKEDSELIGSMVSEALMSLDEEELGETLLWLYEEHGQEAKPLARAVFPTLIQGFCDWFEPEDDGNQPKVDRALESLRALHCPEKK